MSTAADSIDAPNELLESEEGRHQLSAALVGTAILTKSQPELFEEPLLADLSERTNTAMQVATGALRALAYQGLLPLDPATAGTLEAFKDTRLRLVLIGTALELLDSIDNGPALVASLENSETTEEAVEAVANSELGGLHK